jgi:hypothetical protein
MIFQNTESNGVVGIANNPVNSGKRYLVSVVHLLTDGSKAVTQLFRCGLTAATGDLDGYKAYTITASGEVEPVQSEEFSLGMRVWA